MPQRGEGRAAEGGRATGVGSLLRELVAIPSVSGAEEALAEFVTGRLARAGVDHERQGNTVLACFSRGAGPRLLLNSHLDTVPVGHGWTRDPHREDWRDGRLYGRGANDAKASVAAMLTALEELARAPQGIRGEVWLALTACEETTNAGMAAALERLGLPDGAVTGEPTGLEVVRAQSGLAVLTAEWRGRACHAAHVARVDHDNALLAAARELSHCAPYVEVGREHPLLGKSTLVATVFEAGTRHNIVPDRALATFDGRMAPPYGAGDGVAALASRLPSAQVAVRSARLAPIETAEDHPLVRAALAAAGRTRAVGSSTLSDMALLQGVPCVKCGPGETARSHTSDEFVLQSELEAGATFYGRFVPAALEALLTVGARGVTP
ncbi:MAG: M20/M25/M40 family metallo-hydrolase [Planctomycetes bacterium]|nr:M20/M25/M40 family metallo-hydrolase [Planctomycetota bacterium]